ncbi:MAG: chemotaxis protein CheW [Desulfomonile sp.]|nr:chemotaxis protein CheW [Desulfomonile sp.]
MIDTEILQDYISEARELLEEMEASLISLEKEGSTPELLNTVFRCVHCIKGSAEYVGLERSGALAHTVESLLDRLREGVLPLRPPIVELLFRVKDVIALLVEELAADQQEKSEITALMNELGQMLAMPEGEVGAEPIPFIAEEDLTPIEEERAPAQELQPEEPPFLSQYVPEEELPTTEMDFPTDEAVEQILEAEGPSELQPLTEPSVEEVPTVEAATPTPTEEMETGATLEEMIPHTLNLGLYLDDLEDGLSLGNVRTAMLDTIRGLKKSARIAGVPAAVRPLEQLEDRILAVKRVEARLPLDYVKELRSYLRELHSFFPPDTFPSEEPTLPEPEVTPTEEVSPMPAAFLGELEGIPGMDAMLGHALYEAGFTSMDQLAAASESLLMTVPGMKRPVAKAILRAARNRPPAQKEIVATRKPGERSLLADVDEQLLKEFEQVFPEEAVVAPSERATVEQAFASAERRGGLLAQLDSIAEEADREILEIFLSFGWEISEKLRPVVDRIRRGTVTREDLDVCAEALRAMRSSSSYMDYQKLAAFLEEWYEKTLWASEMLDSLVPDELDFIEENASEFQAFLRGVEQALQPAAAAPETRVEPVREPSAVKVKPAEARPRPTPPPVREAPLRVEPRRAQPISPPGPSIRRPEAVPRPAATPPAMAIEPPRAAEIPKVGPLPVQHPPVREAEDMRSARLEEAPEEATLRDLGQDSPIVRTMRVEATKVDLLLNQVGELVVNRSYVEQLSLELKNFQRGLASVKQVGKKEIQALRNLSLRVAEASISLGRAATDLQEGVMKLRMLPVGQLFNRMPRLIRDLCRRMGKTVNLRVQGGDTEVDKRVIEQVYNPLVHLIRNAVDHGIEDPVTRQVKGKSEEGTILLNAYSQGNQVVIDVEDDGAGIDTSAVLEKAIEMGLVDPKDAKGLSPQEIYSFIFVPGFSTSTKVTRTSGRGVGMDVVKKDVERINGTVEVEAWKDEGTRISIKIPLTLAIIQTLLIRSLGRMFAIPLASVREIIQIAPKEIATIEGFEVIKFRDETIPILRIDDVFEMRNKRPSRDPRFLVLSTTGPKTVGFYVEELIGEQDVVIKPLAEHVWKTRGLAGSTILGDGTIALVLDVGELVEDIIARQRAVAASGSAPALPA